MVYVEYQVEKIETPFVLDNNGAGGIQKERTIKLKSTEQNIDDILRQTYAPTQCDLNTRIAISEHTI